MQLMRSLAVRASYSYMHTSLDNLVAAPANQFFASVAWLPTSRLSIDATFKSIAGLYVSPTATDESYMLLGAKVSYTLLEKVKGINSLQLFATLDNITDCDYTINEGYKMPGFNAFGGVKLQF
jgi:iron complex outermembrane receptor protein